ncbi:hypothetical protein FQZ97_756790 [compost metagenome]
MGARRSHRKVVEVQGTGGVHTLPVAVGVIALVQVDTAFVAVTPVFHWRGRAVATGQEQIQVAIAIEITPGHGNGQVAVLRPIVVATEDVAIGFDLFPGPVCLGHQDTHGSVAITVVVAD